LATELTTKVCLKNGVILIEDNWERRPLWIRFVEMEE